MKRDRTIKRRRQLARSLGQVDLGLFSGSRLKGGTRMKNVTVTLLTTLLALAVVSGVTAGTAVPVSGTYRVIDFGTTTCDQTGAQTLHCTTAGIRVRYSGSLQGRSVLTVSGIIDCRSGATNGTATETFTGSVAGVGSGTLTWFDTMSARFDCDTFVQFDTHGTSTIMSGTGALAGLSGTFGFTDTTYEGTFH
jgi:hypothetical protein